MSCFYRECNGTCRLAEQTVDEMRDEEYDPSYDESFMVDSECVCYDDNDECQSFEEDK